MASSVRRFFMTLPGAGLALLWPLLILLAFALPHATLVAPPAAVLLTDRHGEFLGEVAADPDGELGYWPISEIPRRAAAATIAVEDRYLYQHPGVNPGAILRALVQNIQARRIVSGGSTIAMQVARMQNPGPRTVPKKAVEAVTAILLTLRYGRDAVIAHYLTIAPYGNRIRGIGHAARRYFEKPVEDLSWAEVAFLTAIPQAPDFMNPYNSMGRLRVVQRGKQILSLLHARGDLADQEYQTAVRQIASLRPPPLPRRPLKALHAILRLEKAVNRARQKGRLPSPPILKTTLDLALQEEVVWQAFDAMDRYRNRGVGNAAAIVADRKTGEVLALVGSGDYFDQHRAGAIDYSAVRRQTGSTLKPFIFARAIERGLISSCSILDDILRGPNDVENADHRFLGPLLPRFALANSRNVPASRLFQQLGLGDGYAFFSDLGFHDRTVPAEHYGLGLALGSMPVSLEALVRGYTALANDGMLLDLVWHEGQAVRAPRRIMDQGTARLITRFLADPMARLPSFPRMGASEYRFPVAVKTGTSSLLRDVWTVAWSNKYLVGVWLGHPDFLPMNGVSGFKTAAPLVKSILEYLHPESLDGLEDLSFPPPGGYKSMRVCSLTGKLPGPACDRVHLEWIQTGDEPVDLCDAHLFMALDSVSGRRVDDKTPSERIEVRAVTRLPSRYAAWLVSEGFSYTVDEGTTRRSSDRDNRPTGWSRLKGKGKVSLKILEPTQGVTLVIDPEVPSNRATIGLIVAVDPPAEQVVWYVDGSPFEVADYPYAVRWPLSRGEHTFRVGIPFVSCRSEPVTIMVQ